MTDFTKKNSASMTALDFNLKLDDFLENIQFKGFAIDRVSKVSIPTRLEVKNAKWVEFRKRTNWANLKNGKLVSEKAGEFLPAFGQQNVDNLFKEKMNPLYMEGLKKKFSKLNIKNLFIKKYEFKKFILDA